jgi:hypothetical protein
LVKGNKNNVKNHFCNLIFSGLCNLVINERLYEINTTPPALPAWRLYFIPGKQPAGNRIARHTTRSGSRNRKPAHNRPVIFMRLFSEPLSAPVRHFYLSGTFTLL